MTVSFSLCPVSCQVRRHIFSFSGRYFFIYRLGCCARVEARVSLWGPRFASAFGASRLMLLASLGVRRFAPHVPRFAR